MITRRQWRRLRRRLLVSGTATVLVGVTIALAVLSVVGYASYQHLTVEARTATAEADEVERFLYEPDLVILFDEENYCLGRKQFDSIPGRATVKFLRSSDHKLLCDMGNEFLIPHDINGIKSSDTHYFTRLRFASTSGGEVLANHIDILDRAGKVALRLNLFWTSVNLVLRVSGAEERVTTAVFSLPVARPAADDAAQAADDAMANLVTTGGGAVLAFLAVSIFGWIVTRRHVALRRAPQSRGKTDSRIPHQSSCNKAWANRVSMGLIASAVRALDHPDDQDRYREEWDADFDEIPGRWQRLRWALLLRLFAPMGIRSARREAPMSPPQQQ